MIIVSSIILLVAAVIYVSLSIVIGLLADRRYNRDGGAWFIVALLLSPITAAGILLCIGLNGRMCPQCSETVRSTAVICRYCNNDMPIELINKVEESEEDRPRNWFERWVENESKRYGPFTPPK